MGPPRAEDIREAVEAARDLSDTACHLANLAAKLGAADGDAAHRVRARDASLEASLRAARCAFRLDDALEAGIADEALLAHAADTLAIAGKTIRCAREAVEATLPAAVRP